jgi:hypothetical protein
LTRQEPPKRAVRGHSQKEAKAWRRDSSLERQKVEREQKTLIQQLEQITEVCETSQKEVYDRKERAAALMESQVEAKLGKAHCSCEAEMQENEALRKRVIEMVTAM